MSIKICLLFVAVGFCSGITANAQGKSRKGKKKNTVDTLALYNEFIDITSRYQQLPVQAEVTIVNRSNFITNPGDTATIYGSFYLQNEGSYIRIGNTEQLSQDSLLLIVNDDATRMVLYRQNQNVQSQIALLKNLQAGSGTLSKLNELYAAAYHAGSEYDTIRLSSRQSLPTNGLPTDFIDLIFHSKIKEPVAIITSRTKLIPLDDVEYDNLSKREDTREFVTQISGKGSFVVLNQSTTFMFSKISHEAGKVLPVKISDRIVKNLNGEYQPAEGYVDFLLDRK